MSYFDCASVRTEMMTEAKTELTKLFGKYGKYPKLVVIQVFGDDASSVYVRNKQKACEECGISFMHVTLPNDTTFEELKKVLKGFNDDEGTNAILLQLPLPDHLKPYQQCLLNCIGWKKDVDGLTTSSMGRLWSGIKGLRPCTAKGIMRLLPQNMSGLDVLVINRSNLIGKPLVKMLEERNATVTLCHSHTNKATIMNRLKDSDCIITATGNPKWLSYYDVTKSSRRCLRFLDTIIDAAICRDQDGKLCGDIDAQTFESTSINVTKTPGGVGLLTVAQLMLNIVDAYKFQLGEQ